MERTEAEKGVLQQTEGYCTVTAGYCPVTVGYCPVTAGYCPGTSWTLASPVCWTPGDRAPDMKGESTLDKVCYNSTAGKHRSTSSDHRPEEGVPSEEAVYLDDTGVLAQTPLLLLVARQAGPAVTNHQK